MSYPITLLTDPPLPTYPEYPALLEKAVRSVPAFVDPANIYPAQPVVDRRGGDWCTAVLGFPFAGLRRLSRAQNQLLIVADAADVDPPLPDWIVEGRAAGDRYRAAREDAKSRQADRDAATWRAALAAATVRVEVRPGSRPRTRSATTEYLGHAVPLFDAYSGTRTIRTHPAGRALCESPNRTRPLALGSTIDRPATCDRCLTWTQTVRAAPDAPPPTADRHAWVHSSEHHRRCRWCGLHVERRPDPHSRSWFSEWDWPDTGMDQAKNDYAEGSVPGCPGPTVLHLRQDPDALGPCDALHYAVADAYDQLDATAVDVDDIATARAVADRAERGRGLRVTLLAAEVAPTARVLISAIQTWRADDDGCMDGHILLALPMLVALRLARAWPKGLEVPR